MAGKSHGKRERRKKAKEKENEKSDPVVGELAFLPAGVSLWIMKGYGPLSGVPKSSLIDVVALSSFWWFHTVGLVPE